MTSKITLKELLDAEIVDIKQDVPPFLWCPKCEFVVEAGILVVAWDPPSKAYKLQIWCKHCLKESN
jgi:hypothetical protein